MLTAAERAGFEPRDLESLREHYALTLRRWRERLEARRDEAVRVTDEAVYRIWRLMFAGSAYRFDKGHANVYQALLGKPDAHGATRVPLSRADWYV
jgi:cyclopropane-fatty-acyl-phospholipid synthase